jgi:TonB family protein
MSSKAQQPATQPAPVERHDAALEAANRLIGRALILRCFCAENNLAFDAAGQPEKAGKLTDWTLAGVNVQKAVRRDGGAIELDGVRVAVRFAPDRHEFDRHPLNDQKMKIVLADSSSAGEFARTVDAVFSEGIDVRLQKAMPAYWLHYFVPQTPWPKDGIDTATVVTPGAAGAPAGMTDPKPLQRHEPGYTIEAAHDHVLGLVMLRVVVDTQGQPHRAAIVQPLGYGLDASAVEAIDKFKFAPALTPGGQPVAANVIVRQEFAAAP